MIQTQLQSACVVQGAGRVCRQHILFFLRCRAAQGQGGRAAVPGPQSRGSNRPAAVCRAEPEPVSGYTPADFISFSEDENKQCHHNALITVDAPLEQCYAAWSDWTKLLDTFDLIGQIGLDSSNPNMALFQCFYRFRKLPLMEIVFLLEREETSGELFKAMSFRSIYGMPMKGQVKFEEQVDGCTSIRLYFTHPVPNLLVQLQIGPFGVETDMSHILEENLLGFVVRMEAERPGDWEQQRQQVVSRVSEIVSRREEAEKQQQQQEVEQEGEQQPQEQEQQPLQQQPLQQQAKQQQPVRDQQPAAAAEQPPQQGSQPKRPRGRTTTSKASTAAAAAAPVPPGSPPAAQSDAAASSGADAAEGSGRGRKPTRARTAAKAAAPGPDENGNSSSSASKRRSRVISSTVEPTADPPSGNGPPQSGSSSGGRRSPTTRRTSKRASTAGRE